MTIAAWTVSPLTITERVWGARSYGSELKSYALDVTVEPLACNAVPDWLVFEFHGPGELGSLDCWAGVIENLKPFGCRLIEGSLREVNDDEFAAIAARAQAKDD